MQNQRKYRAFISYRHTFPDKPIAEALQKLLEHYRVPGYLQKQGFPARLGLIFRDESELPTSSDLGHQIETALDNSEYLIVICSTHTPQSKYVAAEIDYFKKKNGDGKCLTLLVEGDPSAQKVFPDELLRRYTPSDNELKEIEPIAADVRADTLTKSLKKLKTAALKIIAGLLSCNYDDLVQRQREYRLKRVAAFSLAATFFLICLGVFLLRQLTIVNESRRETRLAYSAQSLANGNHVLAMEQAVAALNDKGISFSNKVPKGIKDSLFNASLLSAFSPYSVIPVGSQVSEWFLTLDGKEIILQTDLWIKGYNIQGNLLWEFSVDGKGDRVAAVSPDGTRAAIIKTDLKSKAKTTISLWDIKNGKCIKQLLDSSRYNVHDILQMNFNDVLGANFSPDGRFICVYRIGGYFNENDSIRFWDTAEGTLKYSFDASLLGTRRDGGQGSIVSECTYFKNGTVRFMGSTNYVYFNPDWKKPVVVPIRDAEDYISLSGDKRFGVLKNDTGIYLLKDRASGKVCTILPGGNGTPAVDSIEFINQKYAVVPLKMPEQSKARFTGISVINLDSMEFQGSFPFSEVSYNQFENINLLQQEGSDHIYVLASHGYRKTDGATFDKNCNTLWLLSPAENKFNLLSEDISYLNENTWITSFVNGRTKDYLISRKTDQDGGMKVLEINHETKEIQNLYHLPKNEEFDSRGAMIDSQDNYLLVRDGINLLVYVLQNQPKPVFEEKGNIIVKSGSIDLTALYDESQSLLKVWKDNNLLTQSKTAENLTDLYLSNNGTVLVGLTDKNKLLIWDPESLKERCRIQLEDLPTVCLSPDGKRIAVTAGKSLKLYNSEGNLIKELSDKADLQMPVKAWSQQMAFSPDGIRLACVVKYYPKGGDKFTEIVKLWDAETGDPAGLIPTSYYEGDASAAFTANKAEELPPSIQSLFFSSTGEKICTIFSDTIWIWDINNRVRLACVNEDTVPEAEPLIDDKSGKLYYLSGGVLNVWDLGKNQKVNTFTLDSSILYYSLSPEKRWLLASNLEGTWLFDLESGDCTTKILNEAVIKPQWVNNGENIMYCSLYKSSFSIIRYLYNKPFVISQEWQNNKE